MKINSPENLQWSVYVFFPQTVGSMKGNEKFEFNQWLVGFYGRSSLLVYLMLNPVFPSIHLYTITTNYFGSAHGVMVIVVGNGHGDSSSNPGREWLHFT